MFKQYKLQMNKDLVYCLLLFISAFALFAHFIHPTVGGDSLSMYLPSKQLLSENNLNMWDRMNDAYNTYYFKMPFTDEAIIDKGESFPVQNLPTIFIYSIPMFFFGDTGFFYANPFMAALIIIIIFLTSRELGFSRPLSMTSALAVATMPVFIEWAVIPQNIIPSTLFFCASLLFLVKADRQGYGGYYILSGMFLALSVLTRNPHAFLVIAYVPFFITIGKKPKIFLARIGWFIIPAFLTFVVVSLGNMYYFGDAFYQGYIQARYHPDPLGLPTTTELGLGADTFLPMNYDLSLLVQTIEDFVLGSSIIYYPLWLLSLMGIFIAIRSEKKIFLFSIMSGIALLGYYSQITPLLYRPDDVSLTYSLPIAIFRYVLPFYVLLALGIPYALRSIEDDLNIRYRIHRKAIEAVLIVVMMVLASSSAALAYNYQGGASLRWYDELSRKMSDYADSFDGKLESGSVILYDNRWGLQMCYQNIDEYHWFYYDGIPPSSRYEHTNNIVESLLESGVTVYFLSMGSPYDTLSKDMESSLRCNFTFIPNPNTYFPRMNAQFFELMYLEEVN